MKKGALIISLLSSLCLRAQVFAGAGGPILNNAQQTYFGVLIAGLPARLDSTFGIEQVCVTVNHPSVNELNMYLQSPSGRIVNLTLGNSSSGANFTNTCFNSLVPVSVTIAPPPYTGTFRPVGYLGRFNTGEEGNGTWHLIVHDSDPSANAGSVTSWSLQFGKNTCPPVSCRSSNLPLLEIKTTEAVSDAKTSGTLRVIDNGKKRNSFAARGPAMNVTIDWHGSSTKNYEKKPFALRIKDAKKKRTALPLLQMPAESDWLLIASYLDKTFLRIPLTHDLFRRMGHYAARYRPVELMLNGEYQGVYLLMEKLKRDKQRINIEKLDKNDTAYPALSGGYIFKIDRTDAPGWYSELGGHSASGARFYYNYVYPTEASITPGQKKYIENYVDSFEHVMSAPYFSDPGRGYRRFIDVRSFIDYFIINELSRNVDAYRLSTYLYKENDTRGGKLYIGPVWDYDLAWHNCRFADASNPVGWQYTMQHDVYPSPTWWVRFMQDSAFVSELRARWAYLRKHTLDLKALNKYIDSSGRVLREAVSRNYKQFPTLGACLYGNPQDQTLATYQTELNDLKVWLAMRISWLDQQLGLNVPPEKEMEQYSKRKSFLLPQGSQQRWYRSICYAKPSPPARPADPTYHRMSNFFVQ
jgi:subtilisin-like proprotein convertase family protein